MTLSEEFEKETGKDSEFQDLTYGTWGYNQDYVEWLEAKINYTRSSLQLPDADKRKEIEEEAYLLNLQNLSGREDFEEAFRLGIMTGIDETIEYLESKAIV